MPQRGQSADTLYMITNIEVQVTAMNSVLVQEVCTVSAEMNVDTSTGSRFAVSSGVVAASPTEKPENMETNIERNKAREYFPVPRRFLPAR